MTDNQSTDSCFQNRDKNETAAAYFKIPSRQYRKYARHARGQTVIIIAPQSPMVAYESCKVNRYASDCQHDFRSSTLPVFQFKLYSEL
jgi:hypothetical protein